MAKSKAEEKISSGAEHIDMAVKNGAEAFKSGFEKAVAGYDKLLGHSKENLEACVKAANAAGKGAETLHNELYTFSKQSIEDSIAATKALLAAKSAHEAFELQSDFAKTSFDHYIGEVSKLSEIMASAAKDTFGPLQGRYQAWVEAVQSTRAA